MKITPKAVRDRASERAPAGPVVPPLALSESGVASAVLAMPSTEAAWLALTSRPGSEGAVLVVRLLACLDRLQELTERIAKGLDLIRTAREAGEDVPPAWVTLLADLGVEELEQLWLFDAIAHAMDAYPGWVEPRRPSEFPPDPTGDERARVLTRATQCYGAMSPDETDEIRGALLAVDEAVAFGGEVTDACRALVRAAIGATHGRVATTTRSG